MIRSLTVLDVEPSGAGFLLRLQADGQLHEAVLTARDHGAYLDLFEALAGDLGVRPPLARREQAALPPDPRLRPVLTRNLSPGMLYGYGDPAVLRADDHDGPRWWLYVTSNDAPNAFPILSSTDLESWRPEGFVFPAGSAPAWTLTGADLGDFWAPEAHRVGDQYWLCFAARRQDRALAVGLAVSSSPAGPFQPFETPLIGGGVIDPHILIGPEDRAWLVWKEDANERWPPLVAQLIAQTPYVIKRLFDDPADRRTAALCAALYTSLPPGEPMEDFFRLQPLIEAAAEDFPAFRARLSALSQASDLPPDVRAIAAEALAAAETRILAQAIAPDGSALAGEPVTLLVNDLAWEGHLVEGMWIARIEDRYCLFYAANDFSTPNYGLGVATADHPLGPYVKQDEPLLGSSADWIGPGHPSVTTDAEGRPRLFLHAFEPGRLGYKAFRALLTAGIAIKDGRVVLTV